MTPVDGGGAAAQFAAIAARFAGEQGVSDGTGFGGNPGLRVDGKIFAMARDDRVVVKLPAERCAQLLAAGVAEPFETAGRRMREWIALAPGCALDPIALAGEAFAYVRPTPADYRCELTIAAPIAAVYDALTTHAGLTGWWGIDAQVAQHVGGQIRFEWSPTSHLTLTVDRLRPPYEVAWVVADQRDENLPRPDEWVGTRIVFRLSPAGESTRLRLCHHGLTPALECHGVCAGGWDFFLRVSLRGLLETGRGSPYRLGADSRPPR